MAALDHTVDPGDEGRHAPGPETWWNESWYCDFVDDAFAHQKFLGWAADAEALLDAAGVTPDEGCPELTASTVGAFVDQCAALRHWERPVRD